MTYEQAIAFWFGRINYEHRCPKPGDLKLDHMRMLLRELGDPHERLRIIHVAGSKGKGSTSAMLAAVLQLAGYRVGLFTSPHLTQVEERIQVDGVSIGPQELAALMGEIRSAAGAPPRPHLAPTSSPTFFEIATALGFLHFLRRRVDIAVVEVGLGGRFDSTNVCQPLVSIITSISLDHTQQLGHRLADIAMEKAGIVKPGRPVISGVTSPEARQVIEATCRQRGSPLQQLRTDFHYVHKPGHVEPWQKPRIRVTTGQRAWPVMELGLLGEHQAANAAVAVACVEQLRAEGLGIGDQAVAAGLAGVRWPARLEVLGHRPCVVLDCAHNVASVQALVQTLQVSFPLVRPSGCHRHLIFACSDDKDVAGMLRVLAPHFAHVFLTRYRSSPRSVPPEQLAATLAGIAAVPFTVCDKAAAAWLAARTMAGPDDLICAAGSVFLAGELRPLMAHLALP